MTQSPSGAGASRSEGGLGPALRTRLGGTAEGPSVPRLDVVSVTAVLKSAGTGTLPPYLGSTLRGAFGRAYRRTACVMDRVCRDECQRPRGCSYSILFETPLPRDLRGRLGSQKAPHPFVMAPLTPGGPVGPGDLLAFRVHLFGHALRGLRGVVTALGRMAAFGLGRDRLPFRLHEVWDGLPTEGPPVLLGTADTGLVCSPAVADLPLLASLPPDGLSAAPDGYRVRLRFDTPVRLLQKGQLNERPDLSALLRALHRRLEALTLFHGEGPDAWDDSSSRPGEIGNGRTLAAAASKAVTLSSDFKRADWDRYSSRQRRKVRLTGALGDLCLDHVSPLCLSWLLAGQWTHIGKATSCGLGAYTVEVGLGQ